MKTDAMDSLDVVELVMAVEEDFEGVFGIRSVEVESFDGPRELVDWLEAHLANQRPNKTAQAMLRKLALDQQRPELSERLVGPWRREQIAAIVRAILRLRGRV